MFGRNRYECTYNRHMYECMAGVGLNVLYGRNRNECVCSMKKLHGRTCMAGAEINI
jgi:hypothetical protein